MDAGYAITAVHLVLEGKVPGASQEQFAQLAAGAKANCPLSKVIKAEITLEARLV